MKRTLEVVKKYKTTYTSTSYGSCGFKYFYPRLISFSEATKNMINNIKIRFISATFASKKQTQFTVNETLKMPTSMNKIRFNDKM